MGKMQANCVWQNAGLTAQKLFEALKKRRVSKLLINGNVCSSSLIFCCYFISQSYAYYICHADTPSCDVLFGRGTDPGESSFGRRQQRNELDHERVPSRISDRLFPGATHSFQLSLLEHASE